MARHRNAISKETREKVAELTLNGDTAEEISEQLKISLSSIHRIRKEFNIVCDKAKKLDNKTKKEIINALVSRDTTIANIAKKFGVKENTIYKFKNKYKAEIDNLRRLNEGVLDIFNEEMATACEAEASVNELDRTLLGTVSLSMINELAKMREEIFRMYVEYNKKLLEYNTLAEQTLDIASVEIKEKLEALMQVADKLNINLKEEGHVA